MRQVLLGTLLVAGSVLPAGAQQPDKIQIDSVAVVGARRLTPASVIAQAGVPLREPIGFRSLQQAIRSLYATGQFSHVDLYQEFTSDSLEILVIEVTERPLLARWDVRGVQKLGERKVRGRIRLLEGRPYDPAMAAQSRAAIDSLYEKEGYYLADVELREVPQDDGTLAVVFDVDEGRRVAISRIIVNGNEDFQDAELVGKMKTGAEGFWWWKSGEYNESELEQDLRVRLPDFYGSRGLIDFQTVDDTLVVNDETGKGTLVLEVVEGDRYEIGDFEIFGNRFFSTEQLERLYPFGERATGFLGLGGTESGPSEFDQQSWNDATQRVRDLYLNSGYIYAQVRPLVSRRTATDGTRIVDLRWQIEEGTPAIVNKVIIRGNTVTHEDVIRRAILVIPGDVVRQEALIRSYQNISNLGFFEQPVPPPVTEQANQQGDINVIFNVTERHTGNINFGASVGQGTGVGGFIGLTEPNLFGRGKNVSFQWQFGRNINDFNVIYSDPALRGSLISGQISLRSSRLRFTVADLGRIRTRGGSIQLGFPFRGSRFTRILTSYTLEQSEYDSPSLSSQFRCANCVLSSAGLSVVRDTRIDMPFPTAGALHRVSFTQNGGPLGGSGNFRRATYEGRMYAPLSQLGGQAPGSSAIKFLIGLSVQSGFVWGDVGPHFQQLFSMGGTQFGIPLRGYDEFSVTPNGFDPAASGFRANTVSAFGGSYFSLTGELGMRLSQALYANTFFDAGNVWSAPEQFNPTRLFRGAGVGLSLLSPLGPIGIDYAYGFDRTDTAGNRAPGWKFHFKLGQFF